MTVTAIKHHDETKGDGYYLVSQDFERVWYKGDTAGEAVEAYCKEHHITNQTVTIFEEV